VNRIAWPARKAVCNFAAHSVDLNRLHGQCLRLAMFPVNGKSQKVLGNRANQPTPRGYATRR
jgi:hypothetical protein